MIDIYKYEKQLYDLGYKNIAGTDEVGRGPMAGPVVAAAVILPFGYHLDHLNDSKKLTAKTREKLYDIIMKDAVEVTVSVIDVEQVDSLNVYQASKKAMTSCIKSFKNKVDYILTDAMKLELNIKYLDLIKGDAKSASIAAASIIAKVTRDRMMDEQDLIYPQYGFKKHKGYVTKYHLEMLEKYGPCAIHRKSFAPVQKIINKQLRFDFK